MAKKYKILILIASVIYVIYHFATLIYSPLPWFDEVSFASITNSYLKHHTFFEEARIIVLPEQKLDYGPVYFMMQAAIIKTFGFSIFNFRITSLLFGLIDLFLVYKICRQLRFTVIATVVTIMLIALEPNFNQFLHSGRMDFVTLFFFFLSYLIFARIASVKISQIIAPALFTGVLLAFAILTTPRIIFAFSFYAFYFIYEISLKDKDWKALLLKYAFVLVGFIGVDYIWIYSAFGSLHGFIYYYTHSAVIKEHTGMDTGVKTIKYNLLIYVYAFIAFFVLLKNKAVKNNINLVLLTLPVIMAFLVLVTGGLSGRYFAMVAPFTYLLIGGVLAGMYSNTLSKGITYLIVGLFAAVFIFKGAYIFGTIQQHDPYKNETKISWYLTKGALVAGDFRYYYIARDNDCSFLSLEENGRWDNKIKYFLNHKVNYFIISKDNPGLSDYDKVLLDNKYKLEAVVNDDNNTGFFHKVIMKLPYKISENYSCYIYKYIGE
jgi:4-amino-4-deoxy-L-arabinose transferase-like glycosyltransferase